MQNLFFFFIDSGDFYENRTLGFEKLFLDYVYWQYILVVYLSMRKTAARNGYVTCGSFHSSSEARVIKCGKKSWRW